MNRSYIDNYIRRFLSKEVWTAWVIFFISLLITISLYFYSKLESRNAAEVRFDFRVSEITDAIQKRMLAYEQVLLGGVSFFMSAEKVTREEWANYVKNLKLDQNYPGILGMGFAIKLAPNNLDSLIDAIKSEGFSDFTVWPKFERDFYTSIIYLEPFRDRNLRAFGYDMFTDPTRRDAMKTAMETGSTALTSKVILVQETEKDIQAGFLMYLPYYGNDEIPGNPEDRRKLLKGFVYSPFRMNDLMEGILGLQYPNINLQIYDGSEADDSLKMYNSITSDNREKEPIFEKNVTVNINGKKWLLNFASLPEFEKSVDQDKQLIILFGGFAISILLLIVSFSRSKTNAANKRLEQLLESTGEGIFGIDVKERCIFINRSAAKMLGYSIKECLGKEMHAIIHHHYENGNKYPKNECPILISMTNQQTIRVDNEVFFRSNGESFPVEYSSSPIIDRGEIKGSVVTFIDITDRKRTVAQIEASLKEKEVLLKEIHHRVKNNLQIISSMLNLQSAYLNDRYALEVLEESKNRVRSMALIHEKLYQTKSFSKLNLEEYVRELGSYLFSSYSVPGIPVEFIVRIEEVYLNIDISISIGLILNELISNSLKYAFDTKGGKITISSSEIEEKQYEIIIEDNGKGLPAELDINNTSTLGLQLVHALVNQVEGTIEYKNENGAKFRIIFNEYR